MTGQDIWHYAEEYLAIHNHTPVLPWPHILLEQQEAFNYAATQICAAQAKVPAPPPLDPFLLALLRKYGRHLPSCSPSAACTCEYAVVEDLLSKR